MDAAFLVLRIVTVLTGLLVPGLGWAYGARWIAPWFGAGMVSIFSLFVGVMVTGPLGFSINFGFLAAWQTAVGIAGFLYFRSRRERIAAVAGRLPSESWLALPAIPLVAVAVYRAIAQPLPGADVDFRWNYLAELMVETGSLHFYPPISAAHFAHYFWADGIAPLLSSVYAWTYLAADTTDRVWTAFPVLLQIAGLFVVLFKIGARCGGVRAGWLAGALGGACMLLQFSFLLGQETGLTALGAAGMVMYVIEWKETGDTRLLVPAALCASIAALAREYGLGFAVVGLAWIVTIDRSPATWLRFAVAAFLAPAAWHAYLWWRTGNPVYSHELAGVFPVNERFAEWMRGYRAIYGAPLSSTDGWGNILVYAAKTALPPLIGAVALIFGRRMASARGGILAVMLAAGCAWLVSIPSTAGGLFYSMRVLSPALILGCVGGGVWLAQNFQGARALGVVVLAISVLAIDASLRALTIPKNPYRIPTSEWLTAGYSLQNDFENLNAPFLQRAAQLSEGKVLSESAAAQRVFRSSGRTLVPLWSPDISFLFEASGPSAAEPVSRVRELGYSHVLLTRASSSADYLVRTGALTRLGSHLEPVISNETFILFRIRAPDETAATE